MNSPIVLLYMFIVLINFVKVASLLPLSHVNPHFQEVSLVGRWLLQADQPVHKHYKLVGSQHPFTVQGEGI